MCSRAGQESRVDHQERDYWFLGSCLLSCVAWCIAVSEISLWLISRAAHRVVPLILCLALAQPWPATKSPSNLKRCNRNEVKVRTLCWAGDQLSQSLVLSHEPFLDFITRCRQESSAYAQISSFWPGGKAQTATGSPPWMHWLDYQPKSLCPAGSMQITGGAAMLWATAVCSSVSHTQS